MSECIVKDCKKKAHLPLIDKLYCFYHYFFKEKEITIKNTNLKGYQP